MLPIHSSSVQIFFRWIADVRVTIVSLANIISYIDDNLSHAKTFKEVPDYIWTIYHRFSQIWIETESVSSLLKPNNEEFHADLKYVKMNPTTRENVEMNKEKRNAIIIWYLVWIRQFIICTNESEPIRSPPWWPLYTNSTRQANYWSWSKETIKFSKKSRSISLHQQSSHFPTLLDSSQPPPTPTTLHARNRKWAKKIIAVDSHTFSPTEQNWSTTEPEAFAIKWASAAAPSVCSPTSSY